MSTLKISLKTALFLLLCSNSVTGLSQASASWNYSTQTGILGTSYSWIDCTSGTSIITGDNTQTSINWPFSFNFYDNSYTTANSLSVTSNGFIRLDGTANSDPINASSFDLTANATSLGQIIALAVFDNNLGNTADSWCRYLVTGTAPDRILTIEYNNVEIDYDDGLYADIQVSFYETLNKIILKLGDDNIITSGVDIGIQSGVNGFFNKWQEVQSGTNNSWMSYFLPVEVVATSGTLQATYPTLKDALEKINDGTHQGDISVKIHGSTFETSSVAINASGTGNSNFTSVNIYPTGSGYTITGSLASPLIDINGADNVTIDGRVNATGSAKDLTITNTNTGASASTVRFINTAENNTIKYCTIKGSSTNNTGGVIFFSTTTTGVGNDGNTINSCNLTSNAASRPINTIFSSGAGSMENSENTISNNNFYDFLNLAAGSIGIFLSAGTSAWTISGNSFYETTTFVPSGSGSYSAIQINNTTSGTDFTVSDNYIGGIAPLCTGEAWTKTSANNNIFKAININVRNSSINNIQNNTIKNFNWSNSGNASWTGISVGFGSVNIGTVTGNIIGGSTGTSSITVTGGTSGQNFYGIDVAGNGTIVCSNNTIGSVTVANSNSTFASNFYGINRSNSVTNTFSNNTIGSISQSNSIIASSASTANAQSVFGINNTTGGTINISSNIIANLTNGTTNSDTGTQGVINGIASSSATNIIANNNISDLTISNANSSSTSTASICGIVLSGSNANKTITGNTISNLSNTSASFAGSVIGLYFGTTNSTHTVSSNFIYGLSVTGASSADASVYGIKAFAGVTTYYNNIISLGGNTATTIYGIYEMGAATQTCRLYFNTIYIGGNLNSGITNKSYALYSAASANTRDYRNNIFNNTRSTTSGSNLHYAAYFNYTVSTLLTLDFNDYNAPGTGGILGYYNNAEVTSLPLITGLDANSLSINPFFASPGSTTAADYKVSSSLLAGITITTIPTDFSLTNRAGTPTMGAFEGSLSLNIDVYKSGVIQATYLRLKDAFDRINNGIHTGVLEVRIKANTTEAASAVIYQSGYTGAGGTSNYSSVTIYPEATGIIITGSFNAPLIDLNGADNVTIDGRVNATGATNDLTLANTNTGSFASAVRFIISAENNIVKYCNINSSCYSAGVGVINFTSSTTGNGNDNNIIEYCNITNAGGNRPLNIIFSSGTSSRENSGNIIRNNNIYNFFNTISTSYGLNISNNSTDWTVSGNSFYETTTFVPEGAYKYYPLFINTGTNHTISNNYIGGSEPLCAGTAWTTNANSAHYYCGIYINGGLASSVVNNTIKNISYTSTEDNPWDGIFINSGNVSFTGNTIGATTGTGSIAINTPLAVATATISGGVVTAINLLDGGSGYNTAPPITFSTSGSSTPAVATAIISGGVVTAINLISGGTGYTAAPSVIFDGQSNGYSTSHGIIQNSVGTVNLSNNNIGSINTVGSAFYSHSFETIYARSTGGITTISNNLIGSLVTSNSIQTVSTAVSALQKQDLYGIYSSGTGTTMISGNTVANLTNAYSGINAGSRTRGIQTTSGSNTIQNNTVRNISTASGQSSSAASASVIGISQTTATASTSQIIIGNNIYDLSNINATAKVQIYGLFYYGPTLNANSVSGNFVHSLSLSSTDIGAVINGIVINRGVVTCANNIVNIGGTTAGYIINGIWDGTTSGSVVSFYFNTLYIGGTVSSGVTSQTSALHNESNSATRNYRNNILFNARTGGTTGKHYAIVIAGAAGLTIDYNDYFFTGTMLGKIGSLEKASLAAWKLGTSQDANSLSIDPGFTIAGGTTATNYYSSAALPGISGTGITTDYATITRGDPPKIGALEINNYIWQGGTSTDFGTASNWTGGVVPPDGADITFAVNPDRNCVLDINRSLGDITNAQATYKLVVNGKQLTINGSIIFTNGAQIDAASTLSDVVFAGSIAQDIPSGVFDSNTIASLAINNVNGLTLNGDLTINEGIALIDGNFAIGPNTLTLNGIVTATTGTVTGGSSTNIIIGGAGTIINMPAFLLNDLTINRESGVSLYGNLSLAGALTLTAGTLTVGSNTLTISGSSPMRTSGLIDASNPSATIVFTNTTAITLPASIFMGAVNNLTINGAGGITAISDFTVNGVLNLQSANASATKGSLDMWDGTTPKTLNMGEDATTFGVGDVTGIVSRTSTFIANKPYTFGNQFNIITFYPGGTYPTQIQSRTIIGTSPSWKPGAIKRTNDYIRTGGDACFFTFTNHYLDSELNGNNEERLVRWKLIPPSTVTEVGRSDINTTDNWLANANISLANLPTVFGSERTLANSELTALIWNGSVSNVWLTQENWTPRSSPSNVSNVLIPDASTTPNDPILPDVTDIKSLTIEAGGILNSAEDAQLTINGGSGAWSNSGGAFNASTGTVIFTNAAATISGTTDFNNLTISSGAGLTMGYGGTMRIGGTVTNAGIWNVGSFTHNAVEYNGGNQTVLNPNGLPFAGYHNLILSGSGTKTMPGSPLYIHDDFTILGTATASAGAAMTIEGNVTIGEGPAFITGNYNHTIRGNFVNNGTFITSTGGTITMNGVMAQLIGGSVITDFDNLIIDNSNGVTLLSDASINNILTLSNGNLNQGATMLEISGTISKASGQIEVSPLSSLNFSGTGAITIAGDLFTTPPVINNLIINRAGGVTLGNQDMTINGLLDLTTGTLSLGANTLTIAGSSPTKTSGFIDAGNAAATLSFTNATAIILPASTFTGIVNNLTINGAGGVTAGSDFTVNGILSLQSDNPSSTKGSLDLWDGSALKTLTMGANATTIGPGDVTGIVKRSTINPNISYSFGNEFTTMLLSASGTLPTDISFKIAIGSAPLWKTDAVQRTYDIIQTGGSVTTVTLSLYYHENELQSNTETDLVIWDYHPTELPPITEEHGKANQSESDNWVAISNRRITYFGTTFDSHPWGLSNKESAKFVWQGTASSDWNDHNNWSGGEIPDLTSDVVIPDASTILNNPILPSNPIPSVKTITIQGGGLLDGAGSTTLRIAGSAGSWNNSGTYNIGNSTVIFTNANATISGSTDFYNLTIDYGAGLTPESGSNLRIIGMLINNGTLRAGSLHNTIEYKGLDQIIINPNGATPGYHNLILSGNGAKTMPGTAMNINGDFTLTGTSSTTAAQSLTILGSVRVDASSSFVAGSFSHFIGGDLENNGSFTATGSTITFNGNPEQTIGGNVPLNFNNLTISDGSNTTINTAGQTLTGILLCNGTLNAGGKITLLSTETETALIDGSGIGSVLGNITMQRYLPSGFGYKYFSSPFQGATVSEFGDNMNLFDAFPSVYRYEESRLSSGWVSYINPVNILNPMHGYAVNFGSSLTSNTADLKGVVNNGSLSVTLYNHNNLYTKGFNLVGNPYPSPINWDASSGWTKTNIDDAIYYFKASSTDEFGGTYSTYLGRISSDGLASNIIPSMQGFFVHVSNGTFPVTATLGFNNDVRTFNLTNPFIKKSQEQNHTSLLRLIAFYADDAASYDPTVLYFDDKATYNFDGKLDALKLYNTDYKVPNFYTSGNDGSRLSINALPFAAESFYRIPLGILTARDAYIVFKIKDIESLFPGKTISISDIISGVNQNLNNNNEYKVFLNAGEYQNRFFLNLADVTGDLTVIKPDSEWFAVFSSHGTLKTKINLITGETGTFSVTNLTGQTLFIDKVYASGYREFSPNVKDGIYIVRFISNIRSISKKIFIQSQ